MREITGAMRKKAHLLMILLVCIWGFEYIAAKYALGVLQPMTLVCFKYTIGFFIVLFIKLRTDPHSWLKKRDLPMVIICSITGEILYFFSEYTAMDYMPVSLVTIMLAFVPILSVIIERIVFKKKTSPKIVVGIVICIIGITFVIGADLDVLLSGRLIGYVFCFIAVLSWNLFNFFTASLGEKYSGVTLTFNQLICTILLTLPYALTHLPSPEVLTLPVIGGVIFLGIFSAGTGFFIYVWAIRILGPTTNSVYSNFMPVSTTIFGFLFLGET
ncbi:MAG: DMT family transporter, partial [Anaerovoracaceae bacterium]